MWEAVGALAGVLSAVVALLGYINTTRKIARDVEVLKEFENIPGRGESRHRDLKSSDLAMKIMMEIV